jgi:hypothetical protein
MIALPLVLDQAFAGPFEAALLRTPDGPRLHLADARTGQDVCLSPGAAQMLAGILALHPFPMAAVSLGGTAVVRTTPQQVDVLQDGMRIGIPAHAASPVRTLLEDLERTRLLFDDA